MATDEQGVILGDQPTAERVPIDYIKSASFRAVHADGMIGGVTPNGHIHFALYSERGALPRRQVFKPQPDGTLGEPLAELTITRGSIIRDMDCDVFVTPAVAKSLIAWLARAIAEVETREAAIASAESAGDEATADV